jgi:hypothetical protein
MALDSIEDVPRVVPEFFDSVVTGRSAQPFRRA